VTARVELQGGAAAAGEKARPPDTPGLPQVKFVVLGLLCLFNLIFHCCDSSFIQIADSARKKENYELLVDN
jgi:hypothetical protein